MVIRINLITCFKHKHQLCQLWSWLEFSSNQWTWLDSTMIWVNLWSLCSPSFMMSGSSSFSLFSISAYFLSTTWVWDMSWQRRKMFLNWFTGITSSNHGKLQPRVQEQRLPLFGRRATTKHSKTLWWSSQSSTRFTSRSSCSLSWSPSLRRPSIPKWRLQCKTRMSKDAIWTRRALLSSKRLVF